jgi:hypothetical protein
MTPERPVGRIDSIVRVHFFPTEEGGRKGPTPPKVFRCIFDYEGELFDCGLLLDDSGPLVPGETRIVSLVFLFPQYIKHRLSPGSRFSLREAKPIGEGEVLEIVE